MDPIPKWPGRFKKFDIIFELCCYHGYKHDDLKGMTVKQLKAITNNKGE